MDAPTKPSEIAMYIALRDPAFASVVAMVGRPPGRRAAPVDERFAALVRSITFQLLATNAADTIHARVRQLCGGDVTVDSILDAGPDELRSVGLSRTKAGAMLELAEHVRDGRVRLDRHGRMSDDDVVRDVTAIRGIGPWTAHMYLLGTLARRDVWPIGDYGVRNGWTIVHDLDELVSESGLKAAGEDLAGVRSSVAWYCWQAVHLSRVSN